MTDRYEVSEEAVEAAMLHYMPSMSQYHTQRDELCAILEAAAPHIVRANRARVMDATVEELTKAVTLLADRYEKYVKKADAPGEWVKCQVCGANHKPSRPFFHHEWCEADREIRHARRLLAALTEDA